jgi:hypothetical protein
MKWNHIKIFLSFWKRFIDAPLIPDVIPSSLLFYLLLNFWPGEGAPGKVLLIFANNFLSSLLPILSLQLLVQGKQAKRGGGGGGLSRENTSLCNRVDKMINKLSRAQGEYLSM